MIRPAKVLVALCVVVIATHVNSQSRKDRERLERARAEALAAALDYQLSLETLLKLQEADLKDAFATLGKNKELLAKNLIGPEEVKKAETSLRAVQLKVDDTRRQIAEADLLFLEINREGNHLKEPYAKGILLRVLKLNALPESEIKYAIKVRGVNFNLSPEDEAEFAAAGASREFIRLIKASYRASR